jgi:hypothetical protein
MIKMGYFGIEENRGESRRIEENRGYGIVIGIVIAREWH